VLLFLRHYRPQADRAGQQQHTAALAIGRNDGRLIMERGDIPAQTYTYDVTADRLKHTVTIGLPAKVITMTLTDKPAPEKTEPPTGDAETEKPAEPIDAPPAAGAMQAVPAAVPAVAPFQAPPVPADPFGPAVPQAVPVPPGQDPFGR
jgi:hypothetical protein